MIYKLCGSICKTKYTHRSLTICTYGGASTFAELLQNMQRFQQLQTLQVSGTPEEQGQIDISSILCSFPKLKFLTVRFCFINAGVDTSSEQQQQRLTALNIHSCTIVRSALSTLSRCCPNMQRLTICNSQIPLEPDKLCMSISLPNCALAECNIENVNVLLDDADLQLNVNETNVLHLLQTNKRIECIYQRMLGRKNVKPPHIFVKYSINCAKLQSYQQDQSSRELDWMDGYESKLDSYCKHEWKKAISNDGYIRLECASVKELNFNGCPASKAMTL